MNQRLYTVIVTDYPDGSEEPGWEPAGWQEWLDEQWTPRWPGDEQPEFYWPAIKIYRSRSAAAGAVQRFERWGATAVLAETEPVWTPVAEANRRRANDRRIAQVARLQAQIDALRAEIS